MASGMKKKNPKRLECLKKKIKELSILCDVEALFLCKEDDPSSNSFYSWPEDRNSCLSLIDKYKRSSVPAKTHKKKTDVVPFSPVLGKRKERRNAHTEFCEHAQENKKSPMGFVDGVDFDDFYRQFCESELETQTVLCENEKLELGFFDGVEFDDNYRRFCELIQENQDLGKRVQVIEKTETVLCQNVVQEIETFQMDFEDFYGKFCEESVENTDGCQNVQNIEEFQKGFFDGLDSDKICGNFGESIQENRDLSYTHMLLCEDFQETEGFQMGFPDGVDFDDYYSNVCESIPENTDLDKEISLKNVDGLINNLGHGDLKEILKWIDDCAFAHIHNRLISI